MTRRGSLRCLHEPFGDAFYYGPERLGSRYEMNEQARLDSGFSQSTYQAVFDRIDTEKSEVRITPCGAVSSSHRFPLSQSSHRHYTIILSTSAYDYLDSQPPSASSFL